VGAWKSCFTWGPTKVPPFILVLAYV
jgi:hypothetical protein